jgi:hypothetical protein
MHRRDLFRVIELYRKGVAVDILTVYEELKRGI